MYSYFESLINPYPDDAPQQSPNTMLAFFWHYTRPVWKILALMTLLIMIISAMEVALFAFLGNIVDWLSEANRETFLADEGLTLAIMLGFILIVMPLIGLFHSMILHQSILGNYGMIMRWQMHKYLLRQSMSFFSDEFAGRVATKVMQTSLAVRDATITILNVMVYVSVYFLGAMILAASFHWALMLPFAIWLGLYLLAAMAGILLWVSNSVTIGAVAVAVGLVLRMNGMAYWVTWELARLFEALGVVQDGMNMLSKAQNIQDKPNAVDLDAGGKPIQFENVCFTYGGEGAVMDSLSLDIKPGEKIGLVGRSGAGKANIGMVTQDTSLLHRTIRENIAYSKPKASDEEIIEAAKRANAWEFIQTLVDNQGQVGLDAQVGERGVKLSGGQRQRIAIARIFLKDAPILVLDEATSALDSEVEAAIQESLFKLMEGKTVIAIAHRLSTIAQLDRLVVMEKGEIIENGTHDELVAAGGIYADLWSRQSGGFLSVDNNTQTEAAE